MTFTTVKLAGHRVVVRGGDNFGATGETVVDSAQWDSLKERTQHSDAEQAFGAVVQEFFAPLTEAAEQLEASRAKAEEGNWFVIEEPVVGSPSRPGVRVELTHDSQVLQLLESGRGHDRLMWVDGGLEISAETIPFQASGNSVSSGPVED